MSLVFVLETFNGCEESKHLKTLKNCLLSSGLKAKSKAKEWQHNHTIILELKALRIEILKHLNRFYFSMCKTQPNGKPRPYTRMLPKDSFSMKIMMGPELLSGCRIIKCCGGAQRL